MAKQNYSFEKRKREAAKKQKKEEKLKQKAAQRERPQDQEDQDPLQSPAEEAPVADEPPVA